jgi:hypothetical protein
MEDMLVLEKPAEYNPEPPDYDGLWKKIIGGLFEDFVAFFAPDLHKEIDFTANFDALQTELNREIMKKKGGKAIADKLFKVFLKSGEEKWVLIHVEVQDEDKKDFPKRMFRYFYRIFDEFDREVYSIALLTDVKKSRHAGPFQYAFYGTKAYYAYNTYDFHGKDIEELKQSANPFATAVIAGIYASRSKQNSDLRYAFKQSLITSILKKYDTAEGEMVYILNELIYFVDCLLKLPNEMNPKLRKELDPYLGEEVFTKLYMDKTNPPPTLAELMSESKQEGIQEGREKGKQEGKKETYKDISAVVYLIRKHYTNEKISEMTKLTFDEIEEIRNWFQ